MNEKRMCGKDESDRQSADGKREERKERRERKEMIHVKNSNTNRDIKPSCEETEGKAKTKKQTWRERKEITDARMKENLRMCPRENEQEETREQKRDDKHDGAKERVGKRGKERRKKEMERMGKKEGKMRMFTKEEEQEHEETRQTKKSKKIQTRTRPAAGEKKKKWGKEKNLP